MNEHDIEKEIFKAMPMPDMNSQSSGQPVFVQLRCTNCGGTMQTEQNNKILCCPYCQSQTLVLNESPADVYKEVEIEKAHTYERLALEREKLRLESEKKSFIQEHRGVFAYIIITLAFLVLLKLADLIL